MKKLFKNKKKGTISLLGIIITITVIVFIQGYLDTTSASYILEETQSILDTTTLATLQSSIDNDGLRYERLTLRPYNYVYNSESDSVNDNHYNYSNQNKSLLYANLNGDEANENEEDNKNNKDLAKHSIWLDGTNAYEVEHNQKAEINRLLKENFTYYMDTFLGAQVQADGISLLDYKLDNFEGELIYDDWGINKKYPYDNYPVYDSINNTIDNDGDDTTDTNEYNDTDDYMKIPQAIIDATITLEVDVDPTFTTTFYNYELYNARSEDSIINTNDPNDERSPEGTYLIDSGFNEDGNLILTIRTVSRLTFN